MRHQARALAFVITGMLFALNGCDARGPEAQRAAVSDCCQCVTAGTPTKGSTPIACSTGTTNANKCSQTCAPNVGGIMQGNCKDGVRCQ